MVLHWVEQCISITHSNLYINGPWNGTEMVHLLDDKWNRFTCHGNGTEWDGNITVFRLLLQIINFVRDYGYIFTKLPVMGVLGEKECVCMQFIVENTWFSRQNLVCITARYCLNPFISGAIQKK